MHSITLNRHKKTIPSFLIESSPTLSFLFAVNRTFEPSARLLVEKVLELPRLPDGFRGRFESMLRDDPELPRERKREIAELLVKSILPMA